MTVQQPDVYAGEPQTWADDEIDLRRYLAVLVAWWREIALLTVLITALAAGAAWLWQSRQPALYAASTDVVIARLTSRIALDERITTSEETQQGGVASWRASLVQLAQSPAIADAVFAELGDRLPAGWSGQELLGKVTVDNPAGPDPRTYSDIIRITVKTGNPTQSALVANAWAGYFVDHVNQVYGQVPADTLAVVQSELENAQAVYLQAEEALQAFIAESQADRLQQQIHEKQALRQNFQQGRNALLAAAAISANEVISSTIQDNLDALTQLYSRRRLTQAQLSQARNLATQLEQADPAAGASNLLALQLLKAQVFARPMTSAEQPLAVDLTLTLPTFNADAAALAADARTLVTTLEGYLAQLDGEIAAASGALLNAPNADLASQLQAAPAAGAAGTADPFEQPIAQLDGELQALRSRLAADQARERQLTQQRDLAWTAYDTLSNKLVELNLTRTATNSEVRIGARAVPPAEPQPGPNLLLPIAAVAAAALLFALVLALVANAIGRKPLLARP